MSVIERLQIEGKTRHNSLSPETIRKPSYAHSVKPTQEQEQMLFRNLAGDPVQVVTNPQFLQSTNSEESLSWLHILALNTTVEGVIASSFQGYVYHIARNISNYGAPLKDRVQAGNKGLLNAIRKFDPDRGIKFAAFAAWDIRRGVMQANQENLGLSEKEYKDLNKANYVKHAFFNVFGRKPTSEELEQQLIANTKISLRNIDKALAIINRKESSPAQLYFEETLQDPSVNVEEEALGNLRSVEIKSAVHDGIKLLSDKEQAVIREFFGFTDSNQIKIDDQTPLLDSEKQIVLQVALAKLREIPAIKRLRDEEDASQYLESRKDDTVTELTQPLSPVDEEQVENTTRPRRRLIVGKDRLETVARLKRENIPIDEIASTLGVKVNTIKVYISFARRIGLLPPRSRLELAEIKRLTEEESCTEREIAVHLGYSTINVSRFISKHRKLGNIKPLRIRTEALVLAARCKATELVREEMERNPQKLPDLKPFKKNGVSKDHTTDPTEIEGQNLNETVLFTLHSAS